MRSDTVRLFIKRYYIGLAIEASTAGLFAFWLGEVVSQVFGVDQSAIGGLWAAISAVIIIEIQERNTFTAAWIRFLSTFVAVLLTGAIVSGLGYHLWSLFLCLVASVIGCAAIGCRNGFKPAPIAVLVVFAVASIQPDLNIWWNCLGRFSESVMGIAISLVIVVIFHPFRAWLARVKEI